MSALKRERSSDYIIRLLNDVADIEGYGKQWRVPIVIASMFNLKQVAKNLIKKGVDINEPGPENRTALFLAAARGHYYMCQILLEAGADKNIKYKDTTPLDAAKQTNCSRIIKLLSD